MVQQKNSDLKFMIRSLFASLLIATAALSGCTDDLSTVGSKFIPENERYAVKLDTTYNIDAYTVNQDSILTGLFVEGPLGAMTNPFLGRTSTGIISEIYSYYKNPDLDNKLNARVLDSVVVSLVVTGYLGESDIPINVYMHELTQNLDTTKIYYSSDALPAYNSEPIATFSLGAVQTKTITLTGTLAEKFGNDLIDSTTSKGMDAVSYFRNKFKGFYFRVDPVENHGAMYYVNFINSQINVYYKVTHTVKKDDKDVTVTDTTFLPFYFKNNRVYKSASGLTQGASQRFITINHDMSFANAALTPKHVNDTTSSATKDTVFYTASFGGNIGYINLKQLLSWNSSLPSILSRAELVVEYQKTAETEMDRIPKKLGLFVKSSKGLFIPIYDMQLEAISSSYPIYSGCYNGGFQKGKMLYSANITKHLQRYIDNKADSLSRIYILPLTSGQQAKDANTVLYNNYSYGVFKGSNNSSPIKLIITHSNLKN